VFLVYKITCVKNGKIYIGQTSEGITERWNRHVTYLRLTPVKKRSCLQRAMIKCGVESFKIELVEECLNQEELDIAEKKWIAETRSHDRKFGYNMTMGGRGGLPTDDVKQKISDSLKQKYAAGWVHPMKGKHHSKETKEKLRNALLGKMEGKNNPFFGQKHTKETRKKMSEAHSGERNGFFGKKHTSETRAKISASKQNISDETRHKISEAKRGQKQSKESIEKMIATRIASTNKKHQRIIQLFDEGISRRDIANMLNFSYALVKQAILRRYRNKIDR
jgi:group I intron endonuclease